MRLALAAALVSSCATAPCPLTACGGVCPDVANGTPVVLGAWQATVLSDELADLRAGLQFQGGASLCAPDSKCVTGSIPTDVELPPDPADLYVTYRTPVRARADDWRGTYSQWCSEVLPGAKESLERPKSLSEAVTPAVTRGEWTQWMFHRVLPDPGDMPQACTWELVLSNPDGQTSTLRGRFSIQMRRPTVENTTGVQVGTTTPNVTMIGPSGDPAPPAP